MKKLSDPEISFFCLIIIIPIIIASVLAIIYYENVRSDSAYKKTNCLITNIIIDASYCINGLGDVDHDSTCYNGIIYLQPNISDEIKINVSYVVYSNEKNKDEVTNKIFSKYTVGEIITCFYRGKYATDVELKLSDHKYYLIFFILLFALSGIMITVFILRFVYISKQQMINLNLGSNINAGVFFQYQAIPIAVNFVAGSN